MEDLTYLDPFVQTWIPHYEKFLVSRSNWVQHKQLFFSIFQQNIWHVRFVLLKYLYKRVALTRPEKVNTYKCFQKNIAPYYMYSLIIFLFTERERKKGDKSK